MMATKAVDDVRRVRPQVSAAAAHQPRVVRLAEDFFVRQCHPCLTGTAVARERASPCRVPPAWRAEAPSCSLRRHRRWAWVCSMPTTPPAPPPATASDTAPRRRRRATTSSSCVPRSTMRPWSRTRIWSASRTVEIRCDTMSDVRSRITPRRRPRISSSVYVSTADSASSRIRIRGSVSSGARERRPLLLAAGQRDAALADDRVVALREVGDVLVEPRDGRGPRARARPSGRARPGRRRRTRCSRQASRRTGTAPAARSRSPRAGPPAGSRARRRRRRTPCRGGGSCRRGSRLISVDLPEPVAPTIATVWPGAIVAETPSQHRPAVVGERQVAELDGARAGRRRGTAPGCASASEMAGSASMTASIRFHEAIPRWTMFVTQPNAIIGHDSITRYALNATNSPSVMRLWMTSRLPEPQHEQRAQPQEQRHARVEEALQPDQPAVAVDVLLVRRPGTARPRRPPAGTRGRRARPTAPPGRPR